MRILCPIATRGRPLRLAGVLHSLTTLASGRHQIEYRVRVDDDDTQTLDILPDLEREYGISSFVKERPITLGQAWNECADSRDWKTWEACVVIADKHLCITKNWDTGVEEVMSKDVPCARWTLLRDELETLLILSRKWYDVNKRIFPEWFPFWFSERWVVEVHTLTFGVGIPRVTNMVMDEPPVKTQGLRDLEFWFDFFARTRNLRIMESRKAAAAFGRPMPDIQPLVADMRRGDEWQIPRIKGYYESRGEAIGDPTPQYVEAKRRAEELLASMEVEHVA